MDFFNHVQNLYTETDHQSLKLDLPLAVFMIKLLSIKSNLINFIPEYKFKSVAVVDVTNLEYLKNMGYSDKESTQALIQNGNSYDRAANWLFRDAPDYSINREFKKYMESDSPLKLRYYLQVTFREEITKATEEAIKINKEENKSLLVPILYKINPNDLKNNIIRFMDRFSDKESVDKLLYSMRDVYILGLD